MYIRVTLTGRGESLGEFYKIGELARITNISKRTIDYYTKLGLLDPERTESNYRVYGKESIRILEMVKHYKQLNMPLDEIKTTIELIKSNTSTDPHKIEKHMEQVAGIMNHLEAEIKEMRPILENLNEVQQKHMREKISPHSTALSQALLLLLG